MGIIDFIQEYFILFLFIGITAFFLHHQTRKRKVKGLSVKEVSYIAEGFLIITSIIFFQFYIFTEHIYYTVFFTIFALAIYFFLEYLNRDKYTYVVNSTILGEEFFNPLAEDNKKIIILNNETQLLKFTNEVYKEKLHIGDKSPRFWQLGDKIKHCDFYDEETGTFFHPEIPELHNFSLQDLQPFYLVIKKDVPILRRENIKLTHFMDYLVAYNQETLKDEFILKLHSLAIQYEGTPLPLRNDLTALQKEFAESFTTKDNVKVEKPKEEKEEKEENNEGE